MSEHLWKVVPLSEGQLTDVNPEDILEDGHLRVCNTYKGGGGYDDFPHIAHERGLVDHPDKASKQFVVQLRGCNLDCPYCYVTRAGVWGKPVMYNTKELVAAYERAKISHGVNVFHLMGGAPAIQLNFWPELLDALGPDVIFHSDLMLSERVYEGSALDPLDRPNVLLAVSIKGLNKSEWERNTRKPFDEDLLHFNMQTLMTFLPRERWYVTFTNVGSSRQRWFKELYGLNYALGIDLINYNAVEGGHVDSVAWGYRP